MTASPSSKRCSACKELLPASEFYRMSASPDGLQYRCKACSRAFTSKWVENNRDRIREYSRTADIRRYGITVERYEEMFAEQNGACKICRSPFTSTPHIDHSHACCPSRRSITRACGGCVRGLLCGQCNRAIGLFYEDAAVVRAAAEYLDTGGVTDGSRAL